MGRGKYSEVFEAMHVVKDHKCVVKGRRGSVLRYSPRRGAPAGFRRPVRDILLSPRG